MHITTLFCRYTHVSTAQCGQQETSFVCANRSSIYRRQSKAIAFANMQFRNKDMKEKLDCLALQTPLQCKWHTAIQASRHKEHENSEKHPEYQDERNNKATEQVSPNPNSKIPIGSRHIVKQNSENQINYTNIHNSFQT